MKSSSTILFLILIWILGSCVPQSPNTKRRNSQGIKEASPGNEDNTAPEFTSDIFWYAQGQTVEGQITINEDTQTVVYLRGSSVHHFLTQNSNYANTYCLVMDQNMPGAKQQMRARIVPIKIKNFSTNSEEWLMRVDIPEKTANTNTCSGTTNQLSSSGLILGTVNSANAAYAPTELCTTCTGKAVSTFISLYQYNSGALTINDFVPQESLNLSALSIRVDLQSNSTTPISQCTNSSCQAKGFDCCLEGQCANDSAIKATASSDPDYTQALAEVSANPAAFVKWPNIYFVCGTNIPVTPTPTAAPDLQATADARLLDLLEKYYCLEEGKKTTPDYATANVCLPTKDQTAHDTIQQEVWALCGCQATPFPTDPADPICPDFGLKTITNTSGSIIDVICDIPPAIPEPTPFTSLNTGVPSRSAPHRFFKATDGSSVDDMSTIAGQAIEPEGTPFYYLDESNKTEPVQGAFSMNAILGQFSTELNRALPAKMINVNYDETYIIRATSGTYTPCPTCRADSWFATFSAFPSSTMGYGLVAKGYSTNRQAMELNTNRGNYEDTIFGRACWLPPTMLPFSHQKNSDINTQRRNRLTTQASMWVNGYQRDWFGFNKGALIGSFDGVRWFAIGQGRRVRATSNKLFLAVNAAYADLADPTDHVVSIVADVGGNPNLDYDFNPSLDYGDASQNQGATCQHWHQCKVDSDCVAKLGWEYTCLDTSEYRSRWPKFDIYGAEIANEEISEARYNDIIFGNIPSGSNKRCVYRGKGAPCKRDYTTLSANDQKQFACAPNYYCEDADAGRFNDSISREPAPFDAFLFGQGSQVLGRPKTYVGAGNNLTNETVSNIRYNASIFATDTTDFGLCMPGKRLTSTLIEQHRDRDSSKRVDYINQISSCDSTATGSSRVVTCPLFEMEENQTEEKGDYILSATNIIERHQQNACGQESQRVISSSTENTFKLIELERLSSIINISDPSLAQDACYRRPGSYCHTDLDCQPNILHSDKANFFSNTYFGGTDAEKYYWQENMICSQAQAKPALQDSDYFDYDLTLNRCCREVGQNMTMFTQDDNSIIPDNLNNTGLDVDLFPYDGPSATGRYSRYVVAQPQDGPFSTTPYAQSPIVEQNTVPRQFQWKTINDTGSKSCCGGGWIRKFADGTNNWKNKNRLSLNPSSFTCLNYQADYPINNPVSVDADNYAKDFDRLCLSPADGGCVQKPFIGPSGYTITNPTNLPSTTATLDTSPTTNPLSGGSLLQTLSVDVPYMPRPFKNVDYIGDTGDAGKPYNYFKNQTIAGEYNHHAISLYLPIYIGGRENITAVSVRYFDNAGNELVPAPAIVYTEVPGCDIEGTDSPQNPNGELAADQWCIENDAATGNADIFHMRVDSTLLIAAKPWAYAGVTITYNVQNNSTYCYGDLATAGACTNGAVDTTRNGMVPGNDLYYLTKLSRLELLGIPQIIYEPIYCNSDRSQLVPGIFDLPADTRTAFEAAAFDYSNLVNSKELSEIYDNTNTGDDISNNDFGAAIIPPQVVYQDDVALPAIFSGHEFMCCVPLGHETVGASKCCSGHMASKNGKNICLLPDGVDLHVYFNKFVSGEGMGEDLPLGGLLDADFIPETGEPKMSSGVYNKIRTLGEEYCESGSVRKGSAFGYFIAEPNNGTFVQQGSIEDSKFYSIVDSIFDNDANNGTGYAPFVQGARWDHHYYCE